MPRRRPPDTPDIFSTDLEFPLRGVVENFGFGKQPPLSCHDALNVVPHNPTTDRMTGGLRAGFTEYFDGTLNGDYSIQDIIQLQANVGGTVSDSTGSQSSYFVYSLGTGNGAAIGKGTDLTAVATLAETAIADTFLSCSCWDDEGNLYVGMQNTSTGICSIFSYEPDGSSYVLRDGWPNDGYFNVGASSDRKINGMVVIKSTDDTGLTVRHLYVAFTNAASNYFWIFKLKATDGTVVHTTPDGGAWLSAQDGAYASTAFSINSINCMGAIGDKLGVDDKGGNRFLIFTTNPRGLAAAVPYGGSGTATNSRVESDGVEFFYVLPSTSGTRLIRRISTAGSMDGVSLSTTGPSAETWNAADAINSDTVSDIVYDAGNYSGGSPRLVATFASAAGGSGHRLVRSIVLGDGTLSGGDGVDPVTAISRTGDTTNTSTTVSNLSATSDLSVGMRVTGTGIPAGATIASIDGSTSITLSAAATATNTGTTLTFVEGFNRIASNNQGIFILARNSDASNNLRRLNTSLALTTTVSLPASSVHQGGFSVNRAAAGQTPEFSDASRQLTFIATSNGTPYTFTTGGPVAVVGGQALDAAANCLYSASLNSRLYFADGSDYWYYDPAVAGGTLLRWTATSAGTIPKQNGHACRLIETHGSRIWLAGMPDLPQNWWATKRGDAHDFEYNPTTDTPLKAFTNTSSTVYAQVGQPITAIIPYSEDVLILGLDHGMLAIEGDPGESGTYIEIHKSIGLPFGRAWCYGPAGIVFFFASHGCVYQLAGGSPKPISTQIKTRLEEIDLRNNTIRMVWDNIALGLYIFVTPRNPKKAAVHYFWDSRTQGWFPFQFTYPQHNPMAAYVLDGDHPNDRTIAIGTRHGKILTLDYRSIKDDGKPISAHFWIGPLTDHQHNKLLVPAMQAVMSELEGLAGTVTAEVYAGNTAEQALNSTPVKTFKWGGGKNYFEHVNVSGHAVYVKFSTTSQFGIERLRVEMMKQGYIAQRSLV